MAADRSSGKGAGKRGAGARKKTAAGKAGRQKLPVKPAAAKDASAKAVKSAPSKASSKSAKPAKTSKPAARRGAIAANAGTKTSPLPPLPPPLPAPPKKLSRSPVRRAVGVHTNLQKTTLAPPNAGDAFSENELREKMRLASAYIDSWLNRRLVFAAEVTAPEDAWAQIWFWLKHEAALDDGRLLTQDLFEALYNDEMTKAR